MGLTPGQAIRVQSELTGFYQVAAVCYRKTGAELEFLLVRTRNGRWTFPKGHVNPGMPEERAAKLEAFEEAGATGKIEDAHFDCYLYNRGGMEYPIKAFLMKVENIVSPPELYRRPEWFSARNAKRQLSISRERRYADEFRRVIDSAVKTLSMR